MGEVFDGAGEVDFVVGGEHWGGKALRCWDLEV